MGLQTTRQVLPVIVLVLCASQPGMAFAVKRGNPIATEAPAPAPAPGPPPVATTSSAGTTTGTSGGGGSSYADPQDGYLGADAHSQMNHGTNDDHADDNHGGSTTTQPAAPAANASSCTVTFGGKKMTFASCIQLAQGGSFRLAWNYNASTCVATVLFQGTPESPYGWAGWAISPSGEMEGSDALVGYGNPADPTAKGVARPYHLKSMMMTGVIPDQSVGLLKLANNKSLAVDVTDSGNKIAVMAEVVFQPGAKSIVVWKGGSNANAATGQLFPHMDPKAVKMGVDFSGESGATPTASSSVSRADQKTAHAFLAATGFGILMPMGILIARHLKLWADPLWFYSHIAVQVLGYLLGVAGWGIGIWLSQQYGDISLAPTTQYSHYCIGITIFCTATLQVFSPVLKPGKEDSKRLYWNFVHWSLGYSTAILAVVNIFLGFEVMEDGGMSYGGWRTAYIVLLCVWGGLMVVLEPLGWYFRSRAMAHKELKKTKEAEGEEDSQMDV